MKKTLSIICLFIMITICCLPNISVAFEIPEYKVVWSTGTTYGILFQQMLTDNEIEKIIFEFREIRKRNEFNKYFPVPKNYKGDDPYGVLQFSFFTDPKWASNIMNKRFNNNKMSKSQCQKYFDNTRGYYGWSRNPHHERGSIGDKFGDIRSKNYRELFK